MRVNFSTLILILLLVGIFNGLIMGALGFNIFLIGVVGFFIGFGITAALEPLPIKKG